MKNFSRFFIVLIALVSMSFLSSCSKKSSDDSSTSNASAFNTLSQVPLASCNRFADANMAFNVTAVVDQLGQVNTEWIKVKFDFLNENITKTGYTIKFYKWRVAMGSTQLDSNALEVTRYALTTGQGSNESSSSIKAIEVNKSYGYNVRLNDDLTYPYQVLKVVAYKDNGAVLNQLDILIPQFAANPSDYAKNSDGTDRADVLRKLHPLFSKDISGWTTQQIQNNFSQYCF